MVHTGSKSERTEAMNHTKTQPIRPGMYAITGVCPTVGRRYALARLRVSLIDIHTWETWFRYANRGPTSAFALPYEWNDLTFIGPLADEEGDTE